MSGADSIWVSSLGEVLFTETLVNESRVIMLNGDSVTVIAGGGFTDYGAADRGDINSVDPTTVSLKKGIAGDVEGNVYVCDTGNHRVRMIDVGGAVSTVIGGGTASAVYNPA
eukprot:gene2344-3049_t